MIKRSLLFLLSALSVSAASSEAPPPQERGQPEGLNGGLMVAYRSPLYVGEDADTLVFPGISFRKGPYYWNGPVAGANLWTIGPVKFGPQVLARWQRFDSEDHPLLEGLSEPQITLEGGFRARTHLGYTVLDLQGGHDLLQRHDGGSGSALLRIAYPIRKGLLIGLAGGGRYQSAKMNHYYYGVPTDRARPDRAAFRPGSTLHPEVQTMLTYSPHENWSIRWTTRFEWLDDGVKQSPIIDEGRTIRSLIGLTYRFF